MWKLSSWIIKFFKGSFFNLCINYLPDAIAENKKRYSQFFFLRKYFIEGNLRNNGGDLNRLSILMLNLERIKNLNDKVVSRK